MGRRTRRRPGFIFIVGWRVISTRDGAPGGRGTCPKCRTENARLVGRIRRRWFTVFFIPVLPLDSRDRAQRISQCQECRQMFDMPIEQLRRKTRAAGSGDFAESITLFNELRDHPNDAAVMLKLLKSYHDMRELREAESAAKYFPAAMAADPACAELLETIRHELTGV